MVRKALIPLFCSLALTVPAYSQEIFVPRELKAQPVHPIAVKEQSSETKPAKPKEIVRRAEPVTEADLKAAVKESAPVNRETAKPKTPKAETPPAKAETNATKEKPAAAAKNEKPAAPKEESAKKAVAKVETPKAEPAKEKPEKVVAPKEKTTAPATAKTQAPPVELPTIKVEKATVAKEAPATKVAAKAETTKAEPKEKAEKSVAVKEKAVSEPPTIKVEKTTAAKEPAVTKPVAKTESVKVETVTAKTEKPAVKDKAPTVAVVKAQKEEKIAPAKEESAKKSVARTESAKTETVVAKTDKAAATKEKEKTLAPAKSQTSKPDRLTANLPAPAEGPAVTAKTPATKAEQVAVPSQREAPSILPAVSSSLDTGFTKIADGFDFPVGKPEADGYYKARGFRPHGHLGEDWDGVRGGDTDLRDPIYSIGDGIVVFARDVHLGWGNVIIVRHAYRESGLVKYIDALYGHLNTMLVGRGQRVTRGQQIATMGNAHGQYDAHLHFEIRKNLEIGMSRSKFQRDFSNYYDPSQFIASHRHLSGGGSNYKVAMNTFTFDWMYHFDTNRNFSAKKRSTGESSAALKRTVTSR